MFMSTKQAAAKWGISERRVRVLCSQGRVDGAIQSSWAYLIPHDAAKPGDGRSLRGLWQAQVSVGTEALEHLQLYRAADVATLQDRCAKAVDHFVVASLSVASIDLSVEELAAMAAGSLVPAHALSTHLLALHMRSAILSMARSSTMGTQPPRMSVHALTLLYSQLSLGLDDDHGRLVGDSADLEALFIQDEQTFIGQHPLRRALFLYAEVLRLAPYHHYNGLLAALVYARIMIEAGWPPVLVSIGRVDELKAALVMTKRRGNYLALITLVSEAYEELGL